MKANICVLVCTSVLMAACVHARWENPGADPYAQIDDLNECRRLARSGRAGVPAYYSPGAQRIEFGGAFTGSVIHTPMSDSSAAVLRELELTDYCMHRKGYELMPAGSGKPEK